MINPILSICIPTYNRATYLEATLNSIVIQKIFQETNEVEIVISDNCSEDNTRVISEKYVKIYGAKIRYFRNPENIKDSNFEKVLSYGKGVFLKLNNDTLTHHENTLDKIIEVINQNIKNKDILFFSNGSLKNITNYLCNDLNSFVKTVSFYSTSIAVFGIWKEDFDSIDNFSRNVNLQLVQTDVLLQLISSGRPVWVDNTIIFDSVVPKTKGGYNFYQIFVVNYLGILEEYKIKKQISKITLFNEKTKILRKLIFYWLVTIEITHQGKYQFSLDKKWNILFKYFWYRPSFYVVIILFNGLKLADWLHIIPTIKRYYFGLSGKKKALNLDHKFN